jgi:nucleotide-binding universal stress UspA family protein
MSAETQAPVIVGVDGSDGSRRAAIWAAATASRRGRPLRLVYADVPAAFPPFGFPTPSAGTYDEEELAQQADLLLERAKDDLAERFGEEVAITTARLEGDARTVLLDELGEGRLLVVGRRGRGPFAELVLGSTSLACASLANGPVVVVPPEWEPGRQPTGITTVGLDLSEYNEHAIAYAFDEASANRTQLRAVHAWDVPPSYFFEAGYIDAEPWQREHERLVTEHVQRWRQKYPDVEVGTTLRRGHAVAVLSEESTTSDLLVVGGHRHHPSIGALLGSVAHGVLYHAACPVAVVHAASAG